VEAYDILLEESKAWLATTQALLAQWKNVLDWLKPNAVADECIG